MSEFQKKPKFTPELRILVASLLSMGVILIWVRFFAPKPPVQPPQTNPPKTDPPQTDPPKHDLVHSIGRFFKHIFGRG